MGSVNSVFLMGRLGRDPEVKTTPSGKTVANFSLATQRGKDHPPEWHRVVVWDQSAKFCGQYLRKGSECVVQGRLTYREWTDKEGFRKTATEIVADRVTFVGGRALDSEAGQDVPDPPPAPKRGALTPEPAGADDLDVPF